MTGLPLATGVDQGLVHIEYQDVPALARSTPDAFGDNEYLLVGEPLVDVVLELNEVGITVVRKRNCMMMPF